MRYSLSHLLRPGSFGRSAALAGLALIMLLFTNPRSWSPGELLAMPLERRFHSCAVDPKSLKGLIVLTGAEGRVREAGRLARLYPHLDILISGTKGMPDIVSELGEGIAPERIHLEALSNNTFENALFSVRQLRPKPDERWLLVTSATHMPRAVGAFRRQGLDVVPWLHYDPKGDAASRSSMAQHEWGGLIKYWLLGRIATPFPAQHEC